MHLVRDPRSAVASHYWRLKQKGYFHFLRKNRRHPRLAPFFLALAAASWTVGNLLSEVALRRARARVLVLRYEDLRDRPAETLERVAATFGLDVADTLTRLEHGWSLDTGHVIGGNGVRHDEDLRFDPGKERTRRVPHAGWRR